MPHKNLSYELLKVNVLVFGTTPHGESAFHVDTLDLYVARQRSVFTKQAAEELGLKEEVIRRDLGRVLMKLEELQDEQIKKALEPEKKEIEIGQEERAQAMDRCAIRAAGADHRALRTVRRRGRREE